MSHEEKINYMKIAAGIVGYGFNKKGLDMLVSLYDLILEKKGETDLSSIIEVQHTVENRESVRIKEEKEVEKTEE